MAGLPHTHPEPLQIRLPLRHSALVWLLLVVQLGIFGYACTWSYEVFVRVICKGYSWKWAESIVMWVPVIFLLITLAQWVWALAAREILTIDRGEITLEKTIRGIGFKNRFNCTEVSEVKTADARDQWNQRMNFGKSRGLISLTARGKKRFFGQALSQSQAERLVFKIKEQIEMCRESSHTG